MYSVALEFNVNDSLSAVVGSGNHITCLLVSKNCMGTMKARGRIPTEIVASLIVGTSDGRLKNFEVK